MATPAHGAYCFEVIYEKLQKRKALPLEQVEHLWSLYTRRGGEQRTADVIDEDMVDVNKHSTAADSEAPYKSAAISRLLNSKSSSSSSSLPSASSSTPSLNTTVSTVSNSSSRTSLSSLPKRSTSSETRGRADEGLFVTWNIWRGQDKVLRGCIGTFQKQDLEKGLKDFAQTSAFKDTRFRPIALRELPRLQCAVTLLSDFSTEPLTDPLDWVVGVHGLRISFKYNNCPYGSTYLPDVAEEQKWDQKKTIISLMQKAGWSGLEEDWHKVDLNVTTYRGKKSIITYSEWAAWREWLEKQGLVEEA